MKYRKKPVRVEAIQWTGQDGPGTQHLCDWCGGRYRFEAKASDPTDVAEWIEIPTLEGVMRARPGDFIIRGVHGEFYPCNPDIFAATYEPEAKA